MFCKICMRCKAWLYNRAVQSRKRMFCFSSRSIGFRFSVCRPGRAGLRKTNGGLVWASQPSCVARGNAVTVRLLINAKGEFSVCLYVMYTSIYIASMCVGFGTGALGLKRSSMFSCVSPNIHFSFSKIVWWKDSLSALYVCTYVCIYVFMYVRMYVCMHVTYIHKS